MALTALDVFASVVTGGDATKIPKVPIAKVAVTANDTLGFAVANTGTIERYLQLSSQDGDFYVHDVDAQTTANSWKVGLGDVFGMYVPMNAALSVFCRAASGTVNINAIVAR